MGVFELRQDRLVTLADCSWPNVPLSPLVLLPLGSVEQHGPHLPLDTDTRIAEVVAQAAAARLLDRQSKATVVVAPAIRYSASGEHQTFPGTMSVGHAALRAVIAELVRSLSSWAGRIVIVNGHGGNVSALASVVPQMCFEGHDVSWVNCATPGGDAHAGWQETSLMLHIAPELVDLSSAVTGNETPLSDLMPKLIREGVASVSPSGVLGDPSCATVEDGKRILARIVADVVTRIERDDSSDDRSCSPLEQPMPQNQAEGD